MVKHRARTLLQQLLSLATPFAAHLVDGVQTEAARRLVRALLYEPVYAEPGTATAEGRRERGEAAESQYEAALRELVKAKRAEKPLPVAAGKPRAKVVNLMDALKRSVQELNPKEQSAARTPISPRSSKKGPTLVKSGKRPHKAA
jgi:hypothetical protein